jgi:DNA ligase-1
MKPHVLCLAFVCLFLIAPLWAGECGPPPVMLPEIYDGGIDVSQYWISEKLDGVRGRWDGKKLCTRGGNRIDAPDWFTASWPDVPMDGELWIARGKFSVVSGIVRSEVPDDDEWRTVKFMVFDLPKDGGTFTERVMRMRKLLDNPAVPWLRPIRQFRVANEAELNARFKAVIAAGAEGLVLHWKGAHYHPGRSAKLLKYKPYRDAEAKVIGYTPGHGKYKGMMGSLTVERPDGLRFKIGTGFTDAQRAEPPPIGSWITYRYNGLTVNGVPRFARFLRIRPEMPPPDPK